MGKKRQNLKPVSIEKSIANDDNEFRLLMIMKDQLTKAMITMHCGNDLLDEKSQFQKRSLKRLCEEMENRKKKNIELKALYLNNLFKHKST